MKREHALGLGIVLLVIVGFFVTRAMIGDEPRSFYDEPHKEKLIAELQAFVATPLTRITLRKENPWEKWDFEYLVAEEDKLQAFTAAARQADMLPLTASGDPVLGTTMTLFNETSELRLIATVQRHALDDIYLSNVFPVETSPGSFTRAPGMEIHLPGLGRWLMMAAPVGCGEALRDKCATGELQPEDLP